MEKIAQSVERLIVRPKIRGQGPQITQRKQISSQEQRFFRFMNIYLERMIFDKMRESMEKYLQFLI